MSFTSQPPTDLHECVERLRHLLGTMNAPRFVHVLFGEQIEYGPQGLPRALGNLVALEAYRPRFAELLARRWTWLNLHALGLLGTTLVVSIEHPSSPRGEAALTRVNLSGPTRAMVERGFDLGDLVQS